MPTKRVNLPRSIHPEPTSLLKYGAIFEVISNVFFCRHPPLSDDPDLCGDFDPYAEIESDPLVYHFDAHPRGVTPTCAQFGTYPATSDICTIAHPCAIPLIRTKPMKSQVDDVLVLKPL